jgi:hypothetical protein
MMATMVYNLSTFSLVCLFFTGEITPITDMDFESEYEVENFRDDFKILGKLQVEGVYNSMSIWRCQYVLKLSKL